MNLTGVKFILLGLMVTTTFLCGLLPLRLLKFLRKSAASAATSAKQRNVSLVLCLLTCFSGGVFLATCFLHLFPELKEHLSKMEEEYEFHVSYPVAELLSCCGFFLLFFLEELFLLVVPGLGHSHGPPSANFMHSEAIHDRNERETENVCERNHTEMSACDGSTPEVKICKSSCNSNIKDEDSSPKQGLLCSTNSTTSSQSNERAHCISALHSQCHSTRRSERTTISDVVHSAPATNYGSITGLPLQSSDSCCHPRKGVNFAEPEACETNCEAVKEDPPILMKSMPHAHIHGVRSITFVLAISFHSVIEGLALGVQDDAAELSALFISLMVHKVIVAFSVGLQLGRTHAHALGWVCGSLLLLALMSPLGGLIGMFVQNAQMDTKLKDFIILIMQGLAVGTFIYVTFFEDCFVNDIANWRDETVHEA
ncbi:Zinc transporter ZIP3 [Toxocara canis]|uniref:Zinc transporter ZIP3 n=1 Tax=Toxocara canis TaxID=6265 RepID=A0A0B2VBK2_TOXCA|nr:Zinc transporter ZIP3 [Toxocara canis]